MQGTNELETKVKLQVGEKRKKKKKLVAHKTGSTHVHDYIVIFKINFHALGDCIQDSPGLFFWVERGFSCFEEIPASGFVAYVSHVLSGKRRFPGFFS